MDQGLTLDDVYKMLGERDVLIYKLQLELIKLREQVKEFEPKEETP